MSEKVKDAREFVLDAPANKPNLGKPYDLSEANRQLEALVNKYDRDYEKVRSVILRDNPDSVESDERIYVKNKIKTKSIGIFLRKGLILKEIYSARFILDENNKIIDQKFISNYEGL